MSWSDLWVIILGIMLALFAVPEAVAIRRKQRGDTLSEQVRLWLRTDTPGGGVSWLAVWATGLLVWVWFLGHIAEWWW